jgi:hypothetical protein
MWIEPVTIFITATSAGSTAGAFSTWGWGSSGVVPPLRLPDAVVIFMMMKIIPVCFKVTELAPVCYWLINCKEK